MSTLARATALFGVVVLLMCSSCGDEDPTVVPEVTEISFELEMLPLTTMAFLRSIYFTSETVGFVTSYRGDLGRTTDGGHSWEALESGTSNPLYAIHFINQNVGYVVGGCDGSSCGGVQGVVLKTENGGDTWTLRALPDAGSLRGVAFATPEIGVAVGLGRIVRTVDGGDTWTVTERPGESLHDVAFFDSSIGIACGLRGVILKTDDAGATWSSVGEPGTWGYYDLDIYGDLALAVGQTTVVMSEDRGDTWVEISDGREMYGIHILDPVTYLGVGRSVISEFEGYGETQFTRDAGMTWIVDEYAGQMEGSSPTIFHGLHFPAPETGYILGDRSGIAKITVTGLQASVD